MKQDLQSFLKAVKKESAEDILEINDIVSLNCEITAMAMNLEKQRQNPILIFNNLLETSGSIVTNIFASKKRIARILGFSSERELLLAWPSLSKKRLKPRLIDRIDLQYITLVGDEIDFSIFPIPKHFESDAGAYITGGVTFAKDPDSGVGNLSYARLQIKDNNRLGVSLHSRGNLWDIQRRTEIGDKPLEVAVVIGMHPAINIAAATRLPLGEDELYLAGGLMDEPVEIMNCLSVDLQVPAYSEIILEGHILPNIREDEGPFGEYTGYSTERSTRHLMEISAIRYRNDMIYHDITPGSASEHLNLSKVSRVPQFFSEIKKTIPNVVDMNYPSTGTHFHCYLSIKDKIQGQVRQAMSILFGLDMYLKLIIVVDEDIDVYDEQEVLWALATRFQADQDIYLQSGMPCNLLDPSSEEGISAKLGLDATTKFPESVIKLSFSSKLIAEVEEKIEHLLSK